LDRQATEIEKMADHVRHGVDWNVLWQYREETYPAAALVENHTMRSRLVKGVPELWKQQQWARTQQLTSEATCTSTL
jgi:hypothetical protein